MSNLATSETSSAESASVGETVVEVHPDSLSVNEHKVQSINGIARFLTVRVFNKAKSAWLEGLLVKPHIEIFYIAAKAEQLQQLAFLRIKTQVANIERRG